MKRTILGVALSCAFLCGTAHAGGLTVVKRLPGYQCMSLDLSEEQLLSNSSPVPVRSAPSDAAPQVGLAGTTVAIVSPPAPIGGYDEMLFPNGKTVWIQAARLRPWASKSDPGAQCFPAELSNGKPGFDYVPGGRKPAGRNG
jgi:hypothetical protein